MFILVLLIGPFSQTSLQVAARTLFLHDEISLSRLASPHKRAQMLPSRCSPVVRVPVDVSSLEPNSKPLQPKPHWAQDLRLHTGTPLLEFSILSRR